MKSSLFIILAISALSVTSWAAAPAVQSSNLNTLDLVMQSGLMAKIVLLLLLGASVYSWAVIITKASTLKLANIYTGSFLKSFWQAQDLEELYQKCDEFHRAPVSHVFKAGFKELKKIHQLENKDPALLKTYGVENISRALTRSSITEISNLENQLGFLATIAAVTPFVGLFGTVWGIMNSFQGIGATGNANLAVVAPGISEALIATAAGLGAAIPAVIAYNHFNNKIRQISNNIDGFSQDFLNLVARNIMKSSDGTLGK